MKVKAPPARNVSSATHHSIPALYFELDGVEGGLQEMNLSPVAIDDELAIKPVRVFGSADQKLQGELFEHKIVGGLEFVIGKWAEDGAWFGYVLDEEFVGEVGEQRVKDFAEASRRRDAVAIGILYCTKCRSTHSTPARVATGRTSIV